MVGLAAVSVAAALFVLLRGPEPETGSSGPVPGSVIDESTAAGATGREDRAAPSNAESGESMGEVAESDDAPSPAASAGPTNLSVLPPMPPEIAEAFERGTTTPTARELDDLERGMDDLPPDVLRDFENAGRAPIPVEILEDFENPYPPIPPEELERLRANGRSAGAQ